VARETGSVGQRAADALVARSHAVYANLEQRPKTAICVEASPLGKLRELGIGGGSSPAEYYC